MEEQEYLREGALLVTSTRIEINGQTFAVRNVGSVKVNKPGSPWFAVVILFGSLIMLVSAETRVVALIIGVACVAWIWQKVKTRTLVLMSGGGEQVALKSTDGSLVERVRSAVAQAISAR